MGKIGWIAVGVCVVLLGLGGTYYYMNISSTSAYDVPAAEPSGHGVIGNAKLDSDPFDVTITYTDSGYDPADITIKQGERVRFLNASKTTTWPASSLHPTHTLYPEKESSDCLGSSFDACQELQPDEYFDFTFYYPGEWRFHDHLHPYETGSITVTEASASQ